MTDLFAKVDVENIMEACRQRGARYGIEFSDFEVLRNTRKALAAAEFARYNGRYASFHRAVFTAYFSEGRDINSVHVLSDIATSCGLDAHAMVASLDNIEYMDRLRRGSEQARSLGVTAIPAFFIEDQPCITGAVAENRFREVLDTVVEMRS